MTPSDPARAHLAQWNHGRPAHADSWRAAFIAAALTAGIFALLPLSDLLAPLPQIAPPSTLVDTLPPPPLPPPSAPTPLHQTVPHAVAPLPQLAEPRAALPVAAPLRMHLTMSIAPGDVAVNFPITPASSLRDPSGAWVFDISETDRMPRALARLAPLYPPQARMRRLEGDVIMEFVVTPEGAVKEATVVHAQPPGIFDQASLQAIQRWRFEPGMKGGEAVPVRVRQKLTFRLEE
ncbi:MAG: energy transducer TonB [Verrucomicrobia bacterium]|nr:energy transducer TonB [Verrucomicrobiota bacterium]